jgi:hypothetical protein
MTSVELLLSLGLIVAVQVGLAIWIRSAVSPRVSAPGTTSGLGRTAGSSHSFDAVAVEVAKRQVAVLADMAEELQAYDRSCLAHARRFCEVTLAEFKKAGLNGIPEALPNDLDAAIRTFARLEEHVLDDAAQARIRKDLEPNTTVLLATAGQITSLLEENRFWLGLALEQELRGYVAGMAGTFADLRPARESLRTTEGRYRAVVKAHPQASQAIERLSAIGAS